MRRNNQTTKPKQKEMKFIIVSSNTAQPQEIESSAKTWGELKNDLNKAGISTQNMVGISHHTRVEYELNEALLDQTLTEQVILLMPNGMKGGAPRKGETREQYNARRRKEAAAKKAPKKAAKAAKKPLCRAIKHVSEAPNTKVEVVKKDLHEIREEVGSFVTIIEDAASKIQERINQLEEDIKNLKVEGYDYTALQKEWNEINDMLKAIRRC
jgi:peptidoglycan/xylan/chitin deacetylase (PgdA/CDA1 family)